MKRFSSSVDSRKEAAWYSLKNEARSVRANVSEPKESPRKEHREKSRAPRSSSSAAVLLDKGEFKGFCMGQDR